MERVIRLLRLISMLQAGYKGSAADLAKTLGVGRRTVFRDLELLRETGIPCTYDRERGHHIGSGFFLPPLNLELREALGLVVLSKQAQAEPNRPMISEALSAIQKLIGAMPERVRGLCSEAENWVSVSTAQPPAGQQEAEYYQPLQDAIATRVKVRLLYTSPTHEGRIEVTVHPYLLHFHNHAWYLLGHSEEHGEVRMFKIQRIEQMQSLGETFERPPNFRVTDKIGQAWGIIPGKDRRRVVLRFAPMVATNVSEVRWHPTQQFEPLNDGGCRMTVEVDGLHEIAWWICGYADQVWVEAPDELREMVRTLLENAVRNHTQRPTRSKQASDACRHVESSR